MGATPYRPLPPDELYLSERQVARLCERRERYDLSPFAAPPAAPAGRRRGDRPGGAAGARVSRPSARARTSTCSTRSAQHIGAERAAGRRVVIAAASEGSLERLRMVLADHGVERTAPARRAGPRSTRAPRPRSRCCRSTTASSPREPLRARRARHLRRPPRAPGAPQAPRRPVHRRGRSARRGRPRGPQRPRHRPLRRPRSRSSSAARRTTACA